MKVLSWSGTRGGGRDPKKGPEKRDPHISRKACERGSTTSKTNYFSNYLRAPVYNMYNESTVKASHLSHEWKVRCTLLKHFTLYTH